MAGGACGGDAAAAKVVVGVVAAKVVVGGGVEAAVAVQAYCGQDCWRRRQVWRLSQRVEVVRVHFDNV